MSKKTLILILGSVVVLTLCTLPLGYAESENQPGLSAEAEQLLGRLKTGFREYAAKRESGVIECDITLRETPRITPQNPHTPKNPTYEVLGTWRITFRFSGARQFYRIKAHAKADLTGRMHPDWQKAVYEFQVEGSQQHGRVDSGKGWRQISELPDVLKDAVNPLGWGYDIRFRVPRLLNRTRIIDIKHVTVESEQHIYVHFEKISDENTRTTELWFNPQKGYYTVEGMESIRFASHIAHGDADELFRQEDIPPIMTQIRHTSELAKFETDIWFPKTVTEEWKIVPAGKTPIFYHISRKKTLQVHQAIFNIPIPENDLTIPDDTK